MRIFVVGMPGEGNFGDDLISGLLIQHLQKRWPGCEIGILHGSNTNPFIRSDGGYQKLFIPPRRSDWKNYFSRNKAIKEFIDNIDLMLIGGGGLFQDSHYRFTVHQWLRYAFQNSSKPYPVWAVGVGFGPLDNTFSRWYLERVLNRLSIIQVRDKGSQEIVNGLGYCSQIAPDIVAGTDLDKTLINFDVKDHRKIIGCSIRPWDGLVFDQVVTLISTISIKKSMPVVLFVLEYAEPYNLSEYEYALNLASALRKNNVETKICCYQKDDIFEFLNEFTNVSLGIACRYHANILWQKLKIPVLPLSYAPKVKRLYEEAGGAIVPIDQIDVQLVTTMFQQITISTKYVLPKEEQDYKPMRISTSNMLLIRLINIIENAYGIINGIKLRFNRIHSF
jgi:polysaccharide pyruvyl transferase WcaK-like protein